MQGIQKTIHISSVITRNTACISSAAADIAAIFGFETRLFNNTMNTRQADHYASAVYSLGISGTTISIISPPLPSTL